jgi:type II secretory pathway pseudopilin PulG
MFKFHFINFRDPTNQKVKKTEHGFTLVEAAVVVLVIGLLIGGTFKGIEIYRSSQATATVKQLKEIDYAITQFNDLYKGVPGDINAAQLQNLPNCTGTCARAGNNNGFIESAPGNGPWIAFDINQERAVAFKQLLAAELLSGYTGSDILEPGEIVPAFPNGQGVNIGFILECPFPCGANNIDFSGGNLIASSMITAATPNWSGFRAKQTQQIDVKIDDGNPQRGILTSLELGWTAGTGCLDGANYRINNPSNPNCLFWYQLSVDR